MLGEIILKMFEILYTLTTYLDGEEVSLGVSHKFQ